MYRLLYESLVGQCEYKTKPKGFLLCHVVGTNGAASLLVYKNKFEFVLVIMCLSSSFRYLVELKLLQNLKIEGAWA